MPPLTALAGGRAFGAFYGEYPPQVIGLHGWARTHKDFDFAFSGLRALAVDLPGFGATPPPPSVWGSREYAESIAEIVQEIGKKFVFVGHSFGGRIALRIAELHPELVRALVLSGTPLLRSGGKPKADIRYRLVKWMSRIGLVSEAVLERSRRRYGSSDYRSAQGVMREILVRVVNEDYSEILGKIDCEVRLVWGAGDSVVPPEVARRASESFRASRLEVLEGYDHYSVLNAGEFVKAIKEAGAGAGIVGRDS